MFVNGWPVLARVVIVGMLAYLALVVLLRVSGKRTLSKMNAFDLIVTVALGSTLATIMLSQDVALADGLAALGVLIGMQWVIAWLSVRWQTISRLVKSEPQLLLYRGHYLTRAMRAERVVEAEILAAVRAQGIATLDAVEAVVLETDGTFSVVKRADQAELAALSTVAGYPSVRRERRDGQP